MLLVLIFVAAESSGKRAAFARRKRRKAAGARLHRLAALVAEGSFEFSLDAEGTLCKIAARVILVVSVQPRIACAG